MTVIAQAFELREAVDTTTLVEGAIGPGAKTVKLHVMRPCIGRGKGRHVYTAQMLEANAHKFKGWRMYVDHLSEDAQRALGGLPRKLRDSGGRVLESKWDPSVPADPDRGFGQGAVVATVRPTRIVRELLEDDPELVEASINARATGVKPVQRGGKQAWMVEGIEPTGSIDWVTEAGAGGRVVSLLEAAYHDDEDRDMAILEQMTDEEFAQHVRDNRPELLEALTSPAPAAPEEEHVPDKTPVEVLREALQSDEGKSLVRGLMESDFRNEADLIRAQAAAETDRRIQVRDLRETAHEMIRAANLHEALTADLVGRYSIRDGVPSEALDQWDDLNEQRVVVKTAEEKLREAVTADVERSRKLLESVTPPTRVEGQGPAAADEEDLREGAGAGAPPAKPEKNKGALWRRQLQESGFSDPDDLYSPEAA